MRIDERTGNITDQPSTVGLMTGVLHHLAVAHDDGEQLALTEWRARWTWRWSTSAVLFIGFAAFETQRSREPMKWKIRVP